jgi:hypothetical protein
VLLQGQSSLIDQLLEGNHRHASISKVLGYHEIFESDPLFHHLLFQDSVVLQVVPARRDLDIKQVSYLIGHIVTFKLFILLF